MTENENATETETETKAAEKAVPMGSPPAGEKAPFQGITHEERESYGEYVRLEADPSDPTAGEPAGTIRRARDKS